MYLLEHPPLLSAALFTFLAMIVRFAIALRRTFWTGTSAPRSDRLTIGDQITVALVLAITDPRGAVD